VGRLLVRMGARAMLREPDTSVRVLQDILGPTVNVSITKIICGNYRISVHENLCSF
jgi:hypothetical protein